MNVNRIENSDGSVIIESRYADYESTVIRKSICRCYCPWKTDRKTAHCVFSDNNDAVVAEIDLPNTQAHAMYWGLPVFNDGKRFVLPGWRKNRTTCYSLENNAVLWHSHIEKVVKIFGYGAELYCNWAASKGGIVKVSADTGEIAEDIIKYDIILQAPSVFRLNERFLLIYDSGFIYLLNMDNDELSMSRLRFEEPSEFYSMCSLDNVGDDLFKFGFKELRRDFDNPKSPPQAVYTDRAVKLDDILSIALIRDSNKKITTSKRRLEKEYNTLFDIKR